MGGEREGEREERREAREEGREVREEGRRREGTQGRRGRTTPPQKCVSYIMY